MCTVLVRGEDEPSTYISTHTISMSTLTWHIIYVASNDMRFIATKYIAANSLGLSVMYGMYIFWV